MNRFKSLKILIIILSLLLNAVQYYLYTQKQAEYEKMSLFQKKEIANAYVRIDSLSVELEQKIEDIAALGEM